MNPIETPPQVQPQNPTGLPPQFSGILPREDKPAGVPPWTVTSTATGGPNRQLYENSRLAGSSVEADAVENSDGFYNAKDPNLAILHEKPQHRMVIYMKAQGKSNREIAKAMSMTESWVSQILRQPWAREQLLKELQLAGRDAIQAALQGAALDSVYTVIAIRDDCKVTKPHVSLAAADSLLDRFLGKATQRVESTSTVKHVAEDAEQVDREIAETEREIARLAGTTQHPTQN
jgi:hypothetical protein